jgi:hypothetical protein
VAPMLAAVQAFVRQSSARESSTNLSVTIGPAF